MTETKELFEEARTNSVWRERPVPDDLLRRVYEVAKMGPTSANCCPMRVVFVKSAEAKEHEQQERRFREHGASRARKDFLILALLAPGDARGRIRPNCPDRRFAGRRAMTRAIENLIRWRI